MDQMTKKRAFAWTVATILAPLVIGWTVSCVFIGLWFAKTHHQGPPPANVLLQGVMQGSATGLWATAGLFWFVHRKRDTFGGLFATSSLNLPMDCLYGLCLGFLWVLIYGFFRIVTFRDMFLCDVQKLWSLPMTFSAGFCEEALFRGFLFLIIARAGGGAKSQIAWTSVAFGLGHLFWGPWGMLWTTLLGATFALLRAWRGNIWPAVVAHTVLNLCIEPALFHKAISGGFG